MIKGEKGSHENFSDPFEFKTPKEIRLDSWNVFQIIHFPNETTILALDFEQG